MGHLWLDVCISIAQSCMTFEQVREAMGGARADLADAKMAARQNSGVARCRHADDASEVGCEARNAKQQPKDCRSTNSVGFSMSQPYISFSSKALRRGAEPSAGVSCKRSHELREGLQREGGEVLTSYSSFCLATEVLRPASREPLNVK